MIYNLALGSGYAEDQSISVAWMTFESDEVLKPMDLVEKLRDDLIECAKYQINRETKECCLKAIDLYCSKCGKKRKQIDVKHLEVQEEALDTFRNYSRSCINDFVGGAYRHTVEILEEKGWELFARPTKGKLFTIDSFDRFLDPERRATPDFEEGEIV